MTIEQAMGSLSIQLEVKARLGKTTEHDAIKLGIEALKRIREYRKEYFQTSFRKLPSETEEK